MHVDPSPSPDLRAPLRGWASWDWVTIGMFMACLALWAAALWLPMGVALKIAVLIFALTLHSSLSHEILHGHPFRSERANTMLGLFQPGVFVPYLRFKALHLAHHKDANLTDPYDDPETYYLDPAVWTALPRGAQVVLEWNNTLLGRIVLGPFIGTAAFFWSDIKETSAGKRDVIWGWIWHLPGVVVTFWAVIAAGMPVWAYLLACFGALAILRIRTFLEHRAHDRASGRSVIIEDRGVLAFLFLNNNFHAVHHMHPQVAWYKLPALYFAGKERFLQVNKGYVYPSYKDVFAKHFLRAKEPVAHPLWQSRQE